MDKRQVVLTDEFILNMSIEDFRLNAQYIGEPKLWELFFAAQERREKLGRVSDFQYLVDRKNQNADKSE